MSIGVTTISAPENGFLKGQQMVGSVMDMMVTMQNMKNQKAQAASLQAQAQFNAIKYPLEIQALQGQVDNAGLEKIIKQKDITDKERLANYNAIADPERLKVEKMQGEKAEQEAADNRYKHYSPEHLVLLDLSIEADKATAKSTIQKQEQEKYDNTRKNYIDTIADSEATLKALDTNTSTIFKAAGGQPLDSKQLEAIRSISITRMQADKTWAENTVALRDFEQGNKMSETDKASAIAYLRQSRSTLADKQAAELTQTEMQKGLDQEIPALGREAEYAALRAHGSDEEVIRFYQSGGVVPRAQRDQMVNAQKDATLLLSPDVKQMYTSTGQMEEYRKELTRVNGILSQRNLVYQTVGSPRSIMGTQGVAFTPITWGTSYKNQIVELPSEDNIAAVMQTYKVDRSTAINALNTAKAKQNALGNK